MIALLLAAVASALASPSLPQRVTKLDRVSLRLDTFDFEIDYHGDTLWQGIARVNRMAAANFSLKGEEAAGPTCFPVTSIPYRSNKYELTFRAYKYGGNATDPDTYRFVATINRSDLAANCVDHVNSEARLEKMRRVRRGQTIELSGKNGFVLRIVRRD